MVIDYRDKRYGVAKFKVPTGNIYTMPHDGNELEFLCIGDYGKHRNIKADFLGFTEPINGVPHGECEPLEEKMVVTMSTQFGCSMGCKFCDVPSVGKGLNIPLQGLVAQLESALAFSNCEYTNRLNVHYARMGEPTFNQDVLEFSLKLRAYVNVFGVDAAVVHPVVSTMMPKANTKLVQFLKDWCLMKASVFRGDAGLQLSINSTSDSQRGEMFSGSSLSLDEISYIGKMLPDPSGRKYCLNFAWADDFETDGRKLASMFDPEKFMVKITPIHATKRAKQFGISTTGGYEFYKPYEAVERQFVNAGFDTLVFIPSVEEDESGITCGNAILSQRKG